jgi:hypothetical protein
MAGPLPGEALQLNANSTHPPFEWSVGIPSDWALVDTAPATWQVSAERLIDEKFGGRKLPASARRTVHGWIEHIVSESQRANTILCVMQFGKLSTGDLGAAGVHLLWHHTGDKSASLDLVREMLPENADTSLLETATGPALLAQERSSLVPPGFRSRVSVQNYQIFLPVPGTSWMLLFSASTAQEEMERVTCEVITAMAHSLLTATPDPDSESRTSAPPEEFVAVDKPEAPGVARGFGTLVRRRSPAPEEDADG